VRLAGVTQQQNEAFGGLFTSMAVAVLLVYLAMVLTFNSLITPFIILFTLPLATIGAFPALYLTGRPIGVSALIGFLMLIGIVVTNAIVLLDLVERLRREGMSTYDALIEGGRPRPAHPDDGDRDDPRAGPARRRLQPGLDHRRRARHRRHRRPASSTFLTLL
jgi:HAE1 family hydrophobic/amphiphilic exporter-1